METISGSAEYYFDESLTGLLSLLSRTLPDREHCLKSPGYADEENLRYQNFCIQALDYTLNITEDLLSQHRHNYRRLSTTHFNASNLSEIRNTLRLDGSRLNEEGRSRIDQLIHQLNRLENLDLDDDECSAKWDALTSQLQRRSPSSISPLDNPLQEEIEELESSEDSRQLSDEALHRLILATNYDTDCILDALRTRERKARQAQSVASDVAPDTFDPEPRIRAALAKITDEDLTDKGRLYFRPIWEAIIANPDLLKLFGEVHPKSYSKRGEKTNDWNMMLFLNIIGLLKDYNMFKSTAKKLTARVYNVEHGLYIDNWEPRYLEEKQKTTVVTQELKSQLLSLVNSIIFHS